MKDKPFYIAQKITEIFKANMMTIYRYIKVKKLKAIKIGKEYLIEKVEFEKLIKQSITK